MGEATSEKEFLYGQSRLENDLIALVPFKPELHVELTLKAFRESPAMLTHVSIPDISTYDEFMDKLYKKVQESPTSCFYAILDKTHDSQHVGILSMSRADEDNPLIDLGIIVFPPFQRTHVASNAVGLGLMHALDPPSQGGLGLRRVEWRTSTANEASRKLALRMSFEFEGVTRWSGTSRQNAFSLPVDELQKRNGTQNEKHGRHTANYSVVWDEWLEKRPQVVAQMERRK